MSSRAQSSNKRIQANVKGNQVLTPYCATCHKAGKSKEEYTNHWTRASKEVNAAITCPLILAAECTYCKKSGHWKKYCPVLSIKNKEIKENKPIILPSIQYKNEITNNKVVTNLYNCLDNEEEEEDEDEQEEEKDEIIKPEVAVVTAPITWASIVKQEPKAKPIATPAKPTMIEIVPITEKDVLTASLEKAKKVDWSCLFTQKNTEITESKLPEKTTLPFIRVPHFPIYKNPLRKGMCWADCDSTDEEDYEDDRESFYNDTEDFQEEIFVE
jgi:hypothetical protein